jgi:hypothetical protein
MAENLILNPTRFNSGVFANNEKDLSLRK